MQRFMHFDSTRKFFGIAALAVAAALVAPLIGSSAQQSQLRSSFRREMLQMINRDRASYGLPPVQLEPSLSDYADRYCEKQIHNKTTGHFTTDGQPPYLRYTLAGGNDGVSENAAAWSANYRIPDSSILDMIGKSQLSMLTEQPPHDGHRRTLLDPNATHVAIGLAWEGGEFRLVQEFIRRYVDWSKPLPRTASTTDRVALEAKPRHGFKVEAVSVHFENVPQEMSAQLANSIETYGLPKNRKDYYVQSGRAHDDGMMSLAHFAKQNDANSLNVAKDGSFNFTVPFTEGAGLYTVVVWLSRDGATTPAPIAASNVSIEVHEASGGSGYPLLGTR